MSDSDLIRRGEARAYFFRRGLLIGGLAGLAVGLIAAMLAYQSVIGVCIRG